MPKGPKKIQLSIGERYYKGSSNSTILAVPADITHAFEVTEWYPGTTEAQKKSVMWLYEDVKRKKVLMVAKTGGPTLRAISIPKKLCGSQPMYYLEASLSKVIDLKAKHGILLRGICAPMIVKSNWSKTYKGPALGKTPISFGDDVHLRVYTEGLNGNRLTIEIYQMRKILTEKPVDKLYNILCENGEINFVIRHTYLWYSTLKYGPDLQELYIKIYDNASKTYVEDNLKQDLHARFLRIENKVVTKAVAGPRNITVAKVGPPTENLKQPDHCKFTKIEIYDKDRVPIFDEGKIFVKPSAKDSEFYLQENINYEYDEYKVRDKDKLKLNKIAEVLMKIPYIPVELGSHTDRFGTDEYNIKLSEKRAKASMDYLISQGIEASRITSKGYGKSKLANPDPKLDKKASEVNRRTTVKLRIFTHNAKSIQYDTIAPGKDVKRILPIEISNFKTAGLCNFIKDAHERQVPYGEIDAKKTGVLKLDAKNRINPGIYSPLNEKTSAYHYLWPMSMPSFSFFYYINSCAYFTNKNNPTLVVNAYSDIRWKLSFWLNLTNDLSVKWQNLTPEEHKAMQKKAGKEGAERRWKQKEAAFGFSLTSDWNFQGSTPTGHDEFKKEWEGKFKKLYGLFSSLNKIADGITGKTKGKAKTIGLGGAPISFVVKPPNLSLNGTWMLERAKKDYAPDLKLGTRVAIDFQAKPLIGLEITIDLLGAIVVLGAGAVSGGSASKPVLEFYNMIKSKLKTGLKLGNDDIGFKANVDVFIDLIIENKIETIVGFDFNTVSASKHDKFKLEGTNKLRVTLDAGVLIKGELSVMVVKVNGYFEATASATAAVTFGHGVYYDQKGLFYKPQLGFDGLDAEYVITASVGLATKKGIPETEIIKNQKGEWEIAKGTFKEIVPKFDVIKSLEAVTGVSIEIPLMRN